MSGISVVEKAEGNYRIGRCGLIVSLQIAPGESIPKDLQLLPDFSAFEANLPYASIFVALCAEGGFICRALLLLLAMRIYMFPLPPFLFIPMVMYTSDQWEILYRHSQGFFFFFFFVMPFHEVNLVFADAALLRSILHSYLLVFVIRLLGAASAIYLLNNYLSVLLVNTRANLLDCMRILAFTICYLEIGWRLLYYTDVFKVPYFHNII
jgi:hypothetical protein